MPHNEANPHLAKACDRWAFGRFADSLRFQSVRALERGLPPPVLRRLLWPWAAIWVLPGRSQWKAFRPHWNRIPATLRHRDLELPDFLRRRLRSSLARFLTFWPDRLGAPRWQQRIRYEGLHHVLTVLNGGAPAVLATLHFGVLFLLRYFLRARGIAASVLVAQDPTGRPRLQEMKNALMASPGLPEVFTLDEVRAARRFLTPGHCLVVAVDFDRGRQVRVATTHGTMRLATGAMRLAQASGARLIPCLAEEESPWRFVVHFGEPVPLQTGRDFGLAGQHLVNAFLPVISRRPMDWRRNLVDCWETTRPESIVSQTDGIIA